MEQVAFIFFLAKEKEICSCSLMKYVILQIFIFDRKYVDSGIEVSRFAGDKVRRST